jgi:two-component system sensor histidine kinase and response regulator WspE
VAAVSTNEEGDIVLILDADELRRSMDTLISSGRMRSRRITDLESTRSVKRLLVVDDSLTVREAERQMLENAGYEVDVAVDGLEAWSAVRLANYDLVITDVDMPRMTGIELVKRIRSEGPRQDVPIIIVSYKDREEDRMRGLEVGANHYVSKGGFSDIELVEVVHDLIGEPER